MRVSNHKPAGFTLLEVLIALSIFSVIGLAAYRVLDLAILSQSQIEVHDNKLRSLERAMHIMAMDIDQVINRPVRDNYADELGALLAPHDSYSFELTRQGWRNPLQLPRSQLQRVAYEIAATDNTEEPGRTHLLRHYWTVLDRAQDSEPRTQVLLQNIDDIQVRLLNHEGEWQTEWPQQTETGQPIDGLPRGLMIELHSQETGLIQRLYQLSEVSEWKNSGFNTTANVPEGKALKEEGEEVPEEFGEGANEYDYDPDEFHDL